MHAHAKEVKTCIVCDDVVTHTVQWSGPFGVVMK